MTRTEATGKVIALLQQAIVLHNQQRLDEADAIYKKVLLQAPRHADALHLRALVFHAKGRFADAAHFAEAAIAAAPAVANFRNTAGDAWRRQGRPDLAQKSLQEALRLDPSLAMAHYNLSLVLHSLGREDEALQCVQRALALQPDYVEAVAHALSLCCRNGNDAAASRLAAQLQSHPDDKTAVQARGRYHNHLAREHLAQQRHAEAAAELERALALYPEFWGNWAVRAELANDALDFPNAERYCTIAANLAPDNEDARLNLGHFLLEQKRLDEAHSHYAGWLAAHPDSPAAKFGLASVYLMRGEFKAGWACYESRWELRRHGGGTRHTQAPQWTGGPCARLLLHAEQGLGDTLQMLRFLPEAVRRCGAVTLLVPPPLHGLAQRVPGAESARVVTALPEDAAFDHVCPLMSLPHVLAAHSEAQLGMRAPYLAVDSEKKAFFENLLSVLPGKKIGIVWQGGAAGQTNRRRPLPLDALAPLLSVPGISLVSLQHGVTNPAIDSHPIMDLSGPTERFDDLAAAMAALDAVISVDTGPAHLAGALGIPAYTLVPWLHDWRWGIDGERSYWYPGMTLVRQATPGDWRAPVARLAALLGGQAGFAPAPASGARHGVRKNLFPFVHVAGRRGTQVVPLFDPMATRSLLLHGDDLPDEADLLAAYLRPGDTVVDAGAGPGAVALRIAQMVGPHGRVLAFEPSATLYACLEQSLQANPGSSVEARRQSVARKSGKATVPKPDPASPAPQGGRAASETIDTVALDSLGLDACALIRTGAQEPALDVLEGARKLIDAARPVLYLSCERPDAVAPLVKFLKQRNYRAFRLDLPLPAAANDRQRMRSVLADAVAVKLLALPQAGDPPPGATAL